MVGRFAEWFMKFPTPPNWVSIFHRMIGYWCNNILEITWLGLSCNLIFNMKVVSIMLCIDNPISGSPFQVPFARLFIFEVNSVCDLKDRYRMIYCLLCIFNLFSSDVFLSMDSARWCTSRFRHPESGLLRNCCMGSSSWFMGRLWSFLWTRKKGVSPVVWVPGWDIGLSCLGCSHTVFWVWVLGIHGIPTVFHCSVCGMGQKK